MIYNYESKILKWMHDNVDTGIKLMTYSTDEDLLTALDTIKEMPAFFYSRNDMEISFNKTLHLGATFVDPYSYQIYPYLQKYTGTIFVESQKQALQFISKLKYAFNKVPQVQVSCHDITDGTETVRVSLWLTNISVEDIRRPNDKIGSCRAVRFTWQSQLILNNEKPTSAEGLVERVNIGYQLLPDGETVQAVSLIKVDVELEDGSEKGTVEGARTYLFPYSTAPYSVTLTATPDNPEHQVKWTYGETTSTGSTLTLSDLTMSAKVSVCFIPNNES